MTYYYTGFPGKKQAGAENGNTERNFAAKFYGRERNRAKSTAGRVPFPAKRGTMGKTSAARGRRREAAMEQTNAGATGALIAQRRREKGWSQAELAEIPAFINNCFEGGLSTGGDGRRVYVTLGQFSIVRLERDSQLLIPVYDYCMPEKECCGGASEDPCGLFRNIAFPVNEFFPPNTIRKPETYEETKNCCCGS